MRTDGILDAYVLVHESKKADKDYDGDGEVESKEEEYKGSKDKAIKKAKKEKVDEKSDMTVGDTKPGDLKGPTKEMYKKSGPKEVEGTDEAEEAPAGLNPLKKKNVKESTNMTFEDLYKKVLKEQDIESPEYNDEMGDFPADAADAGDELGDEGDMEAAEGDTFSQLADLFSQAADLFRQMAGEHGAEGEEMDMGMEDEEAMGEAVSEPEPKEFKGNISPLQAPNKLGRDGVKVVKKKASSGSLGVRNGELGTAPKGPTPGKSPMKVGGSGPAASGKNASLVED